MAQQTLAQLYTTAGASTYVGKVRTFQAAPIEGAVKERGVNFLDGKPRSRTAADDIFQDEFKRNNPGDYKYGQGKVPGSADAATGTGTLTRWQPKALNIAFGNGQHPHFNNGNLYSKFKLFRSVNYHTWTPPVGNGTGNQFKNWTVLSAFSRNIAISGPPKGPSPTGLQG